MKAKRRRRGVLTSMVKYPKGPTSKKNETLLQKIGKWVGGIVIGIVLAGMLAGLLVMIMRPDIGKRTTEGDFQVEKVEENPAGFLPEEHAVAAACVTIENRTVRVPLTAENRKGVEKNRVLHVKYTFTPRVGIVKVGEWTLKP